MDRARLDRQLRRGRRWRRQSIVMLLFGVAVLLAGVAGCGVSRPGLPGAPLSTPTPATNEARVPAARAVALPTPTSIPTVSTPFDLMQQMADNRTLAAGGWSASGVVLGFHGRATAGPALVPEVELAEMDKSFQGVPTVHGTSTTAPDGTVEARVVVRNLAPGRYRWQARFADPSTNRSSEWLVFADGDVGFGVASEAPSIENLAFADAIRSAENVAMVGQKGLLTLRWQIRAEPVESVDHLAISRDQSPRAAAKVPTDAAVLKPDVQSLQLKDLPDGKWYVHLWAVDKAGQVGEPSTVPVSVQRTPPRALDVLYRKWATNPQFQTARIRFNVSHPSTVDLTIFAQDSGKPVRSYGLGHQQPDHEIVVEWDGKDAQNQVVKTGAYGFRLDLVDDAGNRSQAQFAGLTIGDKVIRVSLSKQSLTAYAGSQPVLTTLVTTGGQELPTRPGTFEILSRDSPFTFHSPFPRGSRYWYPDAPVRYAMLFDPGPGNFIHSNGLRRQFGPGTNGPGVPGGTYSGSHGCVNVPMSAMARLFEWTVLGTPVIVTP